MAYNRLHWRESATRMHKENMRMLLQELLAMGWACLPLEYWK